MTLNDAIKYKYFKEYIIVITVATHISYFTIGFVGARMGS